MGVKAGGALMPRFSPPSQPFPATASAEGRQFNGTPFPASATAEGAQFNVPPSPARGEGANSVRLNFCMAVELSNASGQYA